MNTTSQNPATQNEAWGFYGSMDEQAQAAWPLALSAISGATGLSLDAARAFLDSRHGRHFADDVHIAMIGGAKLNSAIAQATQRWMGWSIGSQTSKDYGIPKGLPYLTGFVALCEINEELAA